MTDTAITTTDLTKSFGSTRALDNFNFTVRSGEVHGFLGPNGAGKSTAIRVLLGMLRATSGSASVLGMDPRRESVALHQRLAYVAGDTNLWPNLTGGEAIDVLTRHQRSKHQRRRREDLIERFGLDPRKKARTYSKGNRQKVALISALSLDVDLYLLDEPTSGLDPLMEAIFTKEVRSLREQGRTVLLSSHILGEVEKLCDRVTIIREGTDVEHGSLDELRHLTRSAVTATTQADPTGLGELNGVHEFRVDGRNIRFDVDDDDVTAVIARLAELGVDNLRITPPSLEDLFLRHYGGDAGDRETV
ncbi:ATP-binding cassette domain-containing protein [Corynebacterium halotolerans]|uniref:ABC transporter ATP-binding protein n=1 Tax=Corynebacterium halotolerans TaxID=225326 RepID=UPI003CEF5B85